MGLINSIPVDDAIVNIKKKKLFSFHTFFLVDQIVIWVIMTETSVLQKLWTSLV